MRQQIAATPAITVTRNVLSSRLPRSGCVAFDAAMDGIESLALALSSQGFFVNSSRFQDAVRTAVDACENYLVDDCADADIVIDTLRFAVRTPSTGAGKAQRLRMTSGHAARATGAIEQFRTRALRAATAAIRRHATWPRDPWQVGALRATYELWNTRLDGDCARDTMRTSLQGAVFVDDRRFLEGSVVARRRDSGAQRIEVRLDLLQRLSPVEATALARCRENGNRT